MAGYRHAVPVAGADFDDSVLCHQHGGFYVAFYFGPFDPQVFSGVDGSIGTDDWC